MLCFAPAFSQLTQSLVFVSQTKTVSSFMFAVTLLRCCKCNYIPRLIIRYQSYSATVLLPKTTFKAGLDVSSEVKLQDVSLTVSKFS